MSLGSAQTFLHVKETKIDVYLAADISLKIFTAREEKMICVVKNKISFPAKIANLQTHNASSCDCV